MLDVFDNDNFSCVSLTAAINKLPYTPSWLGQMNLFAFKGISTTVAMIEERNGKLYLIPTTARGTMENHMSSADRKVRPFRVPHLQLNGKVMADEVQNVRAFGTEDQLEGVQQVVNDKMEVLRQSHEYTHEWHRLGAVKGVVYDADGTTVVHDLFNEFGLTQDTQTFDFTDTDLDIKTLCVGIKRSMGRYLGLTPFSYIQAIVGDDFWDALVKHASVKGAYEAYLEQRFSLEDQRDTGFEFPRGVRWWNYEGFVGATPFVATTKAHFYPVGVPDLFQEVFAPADFVEAVNTPGQRVYAKQERMPFDVGVQLHSQSNPLMICSRPQCLIEGTAVLEGGS